ncbi:MAG TPA: glycosyltransferase family 2 protein [Gemmatimonadales bacterium]|nr:glycosyltransferase family 2 protein [Gemmatimonadales bacterium]
MVSLRLSPRVSIIIPCRNEAGYIAGCLDSILASDFPQDQIEILVADGRSTDGTGELLARYCSRHSSIRLIDNAGGTTPAGLNLAIRASSGPIVIRMDVHVVYPPDYISRLVQALEETGADNVGCVLETVPADDTPMARAIAIGMSHRFGVGNSHFRVGATERREVDTVPFGCFRREIFSRIGLFDEELIRNQDDEFNFRVITRGGRVLLLPDVSCRYFARRTLSQLARMYYQYGYFKPLVARKIGRIMTVRQLVPALLLLGLAISALGALWRLEAAVALALILAAYGSLVLATALVAVPRHGLRCATALAAVLPTLHFSYGAGFLLGIWDHLLARSAPRLSALGLSR